MTPQAAEAALATAHRTMLRTPGLQFDFAALPPVPQPPGWLEPLAKLFGALAPFLRLVFWAGLAVGAALVSWFIIRELMMLRLPSRRAREKAAAVDWRPEPAQARALLEDADRLAAEGRFDEAVRLILHRSIDDLAGRRPGVVRPALTSRDIAGLPAMPTGARAAFEAIVRAVESSLFAARPARTEDFDRCRAAYARFAFPEAWA